VHEKLDLNIQKELTINDDIIKIIKNSFYNELNKDEKNTYNKQYSKYIEKAKQLIHFYPKNDEEKKDNLVKKFIKVYKFISGEKFEEEEINTINISLWEKSIKILLIDLLKTINADKNFSGTFERLKITKENENDIIENLNGFYSILFTYLREENEKKIIEDFDFIPNERKDYKKLNIVFCNKDIDEEIKNIFSYLVEDNYFTKILIHQNINLSVKHQEKCLGDIAFQIDKKIKEKFIKYDALFEISKKEVEIEEKFRIACENLIKGWFKGHKNKNERAKFEFVNSHILEIANKIIYEGKYKQIFDGLCINGLLEQIISSNNDNHPKNNYINHDIICIKDNNTNNSYANYNVNYDRSYNINNYNYNYNNDSYFYRYRYYKSFDFDNREIKSLNSSNSSKYLPIINKKENNAFNDNKHQIPEKVKKYYLAQAYVYEDLINSKLFEQIDWKNKADNNEKGEEISLLNKNKYKIKESEFPFEIAVTNNKNITTNIIVQVLNEKRYNYVKLKSKVNQWKLFNSEEKDQNLSIFAIVKFQLNETPEIYYIKKCNLNDII